MNIVLYLRENPKSTRPIHWLVALIWMRTLIIGIRTGDLSGRDDEI